MKKGSKLQGRYLLGDEVASGAMGTIFAAVDERLGRQVAVKIPRAALRSAENFLERFRREALAAASLSHPNVASVFDYGEEEGEPFIVMELVNGRDLARVLNGGALVPERAIWIATQVCNALQHAHGMGIVHRDIKPANVIVCEDDGDRVKVTDFGIARATGDMTLTATGAMFGTPQYISPEQAQGDRATSRSDIYSLGVVLFEMLTGTPPFMADSALAVAMSHVNDDIPAPSSLDPRISVRLDAIVAHATARQVNERYTSAEEMSEALNALVTPEEAPVSSPAPVAPAPDTAATLVSALAAQPNAAQPNGTQTLTDETPVGTQTTSMPSRGWRAFIPSLGRTEKFVAGGVAAVVFLLLAVVFFAGDTNDSPTRDRNGGARQQQNANDGVNEALDDLEELIGR